MERVKVYTEKGVPVKKGVGVFAKAFMEHFPRIPVAKDGKAALARGKNECQTHGHCSSCIHYRFI